MTNKYTLESCHQVGYKWSVYNVPETVTENEVEELCDALADYTDAPDKEEFMHCLEDIDFNDFIHIKKEKIDSYKEICVYAESVHREVFTQDLKLVKE